MTENISRAIDSDKSATPQHVVFHCPMIAERSPLDEWAIDQIANLCRQGWRLSRFRSASHFHLLNPMMGEA